MKSSGLIWPVHGNCDANFSSVLVYTMSRLKLFPELQFGLGLLSVLVEIVTRTSIRPGRIQKLESRMGTTSIPP